VEIEIAGAALSGFLLAMVRATAWVFVCPPFSNRSVPMLVKMGLATALAIAVTPDLADQGVPLEVAPLLVAALMQAGIGLAMGFLGVLLVSAFQMAGSFIDLFAGFGMAQLFDPMSGTESTVFGRFYHLLVITLLFALNGHILLVKGFLTSFDAAPLSGPDLGDLAHLITHDFALFFVAAIEIAAPLLAALFLAEVALGLLARAAPEMNVFVLGMPLKILLTLALAGLAIPLLPGSVETLLDTVLRGFDALGGG
jgi:flagellar biosynthetic protein FliR